MFYCKNNKEEYTEIIRRFAGLDKNIIGPCSRTSCALYPIQE